MLVTVRRDVGTVTMLLAVTAPSSWAGTCHRPSVRAGAVLSVRAQCGRRRAESARAGSESPHRCLTSPQRCSRWWRRPA